MASSEKLQALSIALTCQQEYTVPARSKRLSSHTHFNRAHVRIAMNNRVASMIAIPILAVVSLASLSGCGSGTVIAQQTSPPSSIVVTVSPSSVSVSIGKSQQFTATVQNDPTNSGVAWTMGNFCAAAICGTIDANGKYTAPAVVPSVTTPIQVVATSAADPSKQANGVVSVIPPPGITVIVNPTGSISVPIRQPQLFSAIIENDPTNSGVTWSIGNPNCAASLCGTINSLSGQYFTPAMLPTPTVPILIVATSTKDPTRTGTTTLFLLPPLVTVTILPHGAAVPAGASKQFIAEVHDDPSNQGVTWSVVTTPVGSPCNAADCGTIDSTGKYTASSIASPNTNVLVTATSVTDRQHGADSVSVIVAPELMGVAVSPPNATVPPNGVQSFTATNDEFDFPSTVSWSLSGLGCVGAACGVIDSNGIYTAPASAQNPPTVTVTATSTLDVSLSGSATVMLGPNSNDAKLSGHYAFLLSGIDSGGDFMMAGTITADGNGNITDGVADFSFNSSVPVPSAFATELNVPLTGTYSVGPDGRGSMTLLHSCPSCLPTQTFSFALGSFNGGVASRGQMAEVDGEWVSNGPLALQDQTAFSTNAITGNYAFGVNSPNYQGSSNAVNSAYPTCQSMSADGRFTASAGVISAGQADVFFSNSGASCTNPPTYAPNMSFGGSYNVNANGRGTAVFSFANGNPAFANFSFYVVSASELFVIQTDNCGANCSASAEGIGGLILQQSPGQFSASSLDGPAFMNFSDDQAYNTLFASLVTFDASGTLSGVSDSVSYDDGGVTTISVGGAYAVDPDGLGRGVLTLSGDLYPRPIYLVGPGKGFVVDPVTGQPGMIELQSAGPFTNASVSGTYVLNIETPDADGPGNGIGGLSYVEGPGTGIVILDGKGGMQGIADAPDGRGGGIGTTFTGIYSIDASGRGTLTTTPGTGPQLSWIVYVASPSKIFLRRTLTICTQATIQK